NFVAKGEGSGGGNGSKAPYGSFQNFGYLNFLHTLPGEVKNYERTLDLEKALATTEFEVDGTSYLREYFTSFDANVGVIRLTASKKKAITFATHFYRDENLSDIKVSEDMIDWQGALPDGKGGKGLHFAGKVKIVADGGTKQVYDNQTIVKNADQVLIFFVASTDYYGEVPTKLITKELVNVERNAYKKLLSSHQKRFSEKFDRVSLELNGNAENEALTTDLRIANFYEHPQTDNNLATLYYQFGRYLSISSTAPDTKNALPPNLQGLWAHQIQTPWNGDYHLNINAQMNHWGTEVSNLSEY